MTPFWTVPPTAFLLERAADFFELRLRKRDAVYSAHALATAMRSFLPDTDGGWLGGRSGFHG
jgi:hypothetical protein